MEWTLARTARERAHHVVHRLAAVLVTGRVLERFEKVVAPRRLALNHAFEGSSHILVPAQLQAPGPLVDAREQLRGEVGGRYGPTQVRPRLAFSRQTMASSSLELPRIYDACVCSRAYAALRRWSCEAHIRQCHGKSTS